MSWPVSPPALGRSGDRVIVIRLFRTGSKPHQLDADDAVTRCSMPCKPVCIWPWRTTVFVAAPNSGAVGTGVCLTSERERPTIAWHMSHAELRRRVGPPHTGGGAHPEV